MARVLDCDLGGLRSSPSCTADLLYDLGQVTSLFGASVYGDNDTDLLCDALGPLVIVKAS